MARLIVDTTVLISLERGSSELAGVAPDDDVALAATTAAELLVGVELADDRHRAAREAFVEDVLDELAVEDYDLDVARAHAGLLAHTSRLGRPRGADDLIIAATALARDRIVVTADASGFEGLPGVRLRPARP